MTCWRTSWARHAWRPAHLHFEIDADGYQPLTTQLYFAGDPYLDSDTAGAVKDSLVIDLTKTDAGGVSYRGEYVFRLAPGLTSPPATAVRQAAPSEPGPGQARRSTIDLFDREFVLLTGPGGGAVADAALTTARACKVPLAAITVAEPHWASLYEVDPSGAVLVRPGGRVAWRTRTAPADPAQAITAVPTPRPAPPATGRRPARAGPAAPHRQAPAGWR